MEPELERRVRERTLELETANEALRRSQEMLAKELDAAQRLQHVATQLIKTRGTEALYEEVLDAAMAILHSDFASIQMFCPEHGTSGELRLLGHRGFSAEAVKRWEWVRPTTRTSCGEALRTGRRVVVSDVRNCDFMSGSEDLEGYLGGGIHAVQTTPLVSRSDILLGMVSTHWREPHELSATELRALDILARLAADLIEHSQSEAALLRSSGFQAAIMSNMAEGLYTLDAEGCVTSMNPAAETLFGRTFEELRGRRMHEMTHYKHRDGTPFPVEQCAGLQVLKQGHRLSGHEDCFIRKDGTFFDVIYSSSPLYDDEQIIGVVVVFRDVTASKVAQAESFARQKLKAVGALAGGIAHHFNNLLGGILAEAELVETDLAAGSAPREEIQKIKMAAIRGSEIVRELMIYAGENQQNLNETVDVPQLVEEMLELLKVSISKRVALKADFPGDLPTVLGNAPHIRQVVMNLVLNASEAIGDKEGVITVAAALVSGGRDLAPGNATELTPGDYVRIEVSDTGCGMTEETKAKIFDPFFSTKFPGRGLGLAVVQGIVRDLGGAMNIVSAPGQGTVFQVLLPSAPKRASKIQNTIALGGLDESNAQSLAILVVEDEETLRQAVAKGLRKRGFLVIEASNGTVALDLIQAHKGNIHVVLLDVTLPGASSREVLEEALRLRPDVKVIVTSAYDEQMVNATYSGLRVNHFIRKPFLLDDLVRLFGSALSAKAR